MNIGFVVHDYDPRDGHGRYAVELVSRLALEHTVTLYASNISADPPHGVRVQRVHAIRRPAHLTILTFPGAFESVRQTHDVVHVQGWSAKQADVATAHIVLAAWRKALRAGGGKPGLGERLFGAWVTGRERAFYRSQVGHVIAPSERVRADLEREYGRKDDVHVVQHGFEHRAAESGQGRPRAFVALYAGDARKGLDVALAAVARAEGVHLNVVSRSALDSYRGLAQSLGVAQRVHWLGALDSLDAVYADVDVLLHPSVYDAFGLVVAEAMAHGVPPIVSRQAGIAELVRHDVSGWIVDARDVDGIAHALLALERDPVRRQAMGRAAQDAASERSWDTVVRETVDVYNQAAAR